MHPPASVEGRERLRLFVGLPLPGDAVERLVDWQARSLAGRGEARLVPPENLHATVAFLGSRPAADADAVLDVLRAAAAGARPPVLVPARYRETRSVGMLVFADEDGRAARLAAEVGEALERLGLYERERREWLPHVTVLRFRRPPRLSPPLPDLPRVSPSEVALYHSVLRPTGAQYEIVESVALDA
ncbi:MAG TPA: RNA 2',3'-cyclic phosphodiesterase [Gaiellaceae bacterium]|nr:RNA 2',3'-cyclic phosphodiesterase [Gaiellaceae bacterium]